MCVVRASWLAMWWLDVATWYSRIILLIAFEANRTRCFRTVHDVNIDAMENEQKSIHVIRAAGSRSEISPLAHVSTIR